MSEEIGGEATGCSDAAAAGPEIAISVLESRRERAAAEVLAAAFRDGPSSYAVVGESPTRRLRSNRHGMRQALRACRGIGLVLEAQTPVESAALALRLPGRPHGVLVALPPDAFPLTPPGLGAQLHSALVQGLGVATRWGEVYRDLAAVHPREPHWYLSLLCAAPERQRRGIGSALLASWLERVDVDAAASYLETDLVSNVAFYERAGFEVRGEVKALGTTVWCLWRPARDGSGAGLDARASGTRQVDGVNRA